MGTVEKIIFPYCLRPEPSGENIAIFFGTDFYNLPAGSNERLFIERTDQMLAYMRARLAHCRLLYQPHPNETDEYTKLNLKGFEVGQKMIAEVLLYEQASSVQFVLSACSGASLSAYAMGFNAAVAINLLSDALPEDAIAGYGQYFAGAPDAFFLRHLNGPLPVRSRVSQEEEQRASALIKEAIGSPKKLWVLIQSPGFAIQAVRMLQLARESNPSMQACILTIGGRRWSTMPAVSKLLDEFDETLRLRDSRILYSARPQRLLEAAREAYKIKCLPISVGDVVVSFCYTMFEEDCVISYHKHKARMIGLIENRWYHFTFVNRGHSLPQSGFRAPHGALAFAWLLEPLLGLYRTVTREYKDGRVINFFRYRLPLESVYDTAIILLPTASSFADNKETEVRDLSI